MKKLYIVFSATSYKTGSFIRAMTRGEYNHVSVAFDPDLDEVYSFGRLWLHTPFCAGFVREQRARYVINGRRALVSVCEIEIDEAHMRAVRRRISEMMVDGPDRYVYNMASAALVPIRRRARIRDCYTCIEFAVSLLLTAGYPIEDRFYSISELYRILSPGEIYRGEYPVGELELSGTHAANSEPYDRRLPVRSRISITTRQLWRMTHRMIKP